MLDILTYTIIPFVMFGAMSISLYIFYGIIELLTGVGKTLKEDALHIFGGPAKQRKG